MSFTSGVFIRFNFSPPAGISSILFETRLGCLQEEIPKDTLRFITAVNNMLTLSETVVLFPRWSRGVLPLWNRFVQAWDDLYDVGTVQQQQENMNYSFRFGHNIDNFLIYVFFYGSQDPHRQESG